LHGLMKMDGPQALKMGLRNPLKILIDSSSHFPVNDSASWLLQRGGIFVCLHRMSNTMGTQRRDAQDPLTSILVQKGSHGETETNSSSD